MEILFNILLMILWGALCSRMAKNRNRDSIIGFILGALFGLIAVIGYAIAGDNKRNKEINKKIKSI